ELGSPAAGELFDHRLAGAIENPDGQAHGGDPGADVDDRATAALGHRRGELGHEVEGGADVDGDDPIEGFIVSLGGGWSRVGPGVVDQDVDAATEGLGGVVGQSPGGGRCWRGELGGDERGAAPGCGDFLDDAGPAPRVAAGHRYSGAL